LTLKALADQIEAVKERLAAVRTEHEKAVAPAFQTAAETAQRFEDAQVVAADLKLAEDRADAAKRTARVRLAEGIGNEAEVKAATKAAEIAHERRLAGDDLVTGLGARAADASAASRAAAAEARRREQAALLALLSIEVQAIAPHAEEIAIHAERLRAILPAVERAFSPAPGAFGYSSGWRSEWAEIVNGLFLRAFGMNTCLWLTWRSAAVRAGFLKPSAEDRIRSEREAREVRTAEERARRQAAAHERRAAEVWHDGEQPLPEVV
jgi:hypothetical protein